MHCGYCKLTETGCDTKSDHGCCILQANQQVQQAWAQAQSKEPLNKRASLLASSASNAQDRVQTQASSSQSQQPQQSQPANHPARQQSRRESRDQPQPQSHAEHAMHAVQPSSSGSDTFGLQSSSGQMTGRFNGGQSGEGQFGAGPQGSGHLSAMQSVPANALLSGMQALFPGQGESVYDLP